MPSYIDVSGRSVVSLSGPDALDLLQRISTNDVLSLNVGRTVSTVLTNEKGRIVDVVSIAKSEDGQLLLLGNSTKPNGLFSWIDKFIIMEEIRIEDLTHNSSCKLLYDLKVSEEHFPPRDLSEISTTFEETWGPEHIAYTVAPRSNESTLAKQLERMEFVEATPDDFEKYRIINGIPAYPNELSESYNPLEANLSSLISWTKGCYVGQEVIARLDTYKKIQRSLFRMTLGDLPSSLPQTIFDEEGEAGTITSAIREGSNGAIRALGYVKLLREASGRNMYYGRGEERVAVRLEQNPV